MASCVELAALHALSLQSGERHEPRWFQRPFLLQVQAWWLPLFERSLWSLQAMQTSQLRP
jgi:hypothetical protein